MSDLWVSDSTTKRYSAKEEVISRREEKEDYFSKTKF